MLRFERFAAMQRAKGSARRALTSKNAKSTKFFVSFVPLDVGRRRKSVVSVSSVVGSRRFSKKLTARYHNARSKYI